MAKRKLHSEDEKAEAVALLISNGYPDILGALQKTADVVGVSTQTLRRWANGHQSAPSVTDVTHKKRELAGRFELVMHNMLDHAERPEIIARLTAKDALIGASTAFDKLRLMDGLPTEIISVLPDFVATLEANGIDPTQFIQRAIARINAKRS